MEIGGTIITPSTPTDNLSSMTYAQSGRRETTAAANHATLYSVADYSSGGGILSHIGYRHENDVQLKGYIKITLDGNATVWDVADVSTLTGLLFAPRYNTIVNLVLSLEFTSSCLYEIGNDDSVTADIVGHAHYGITSKEIGRAIIPANTLIPGRDYTYPHDTLSIFYTSLHPPKYSSEDTVKAQLVLNDMLRAGEYDSSIMAQYLISSRLEFLSSDHVAATVDESGRVSGELKTHKFERVNGVWQKTWTRSKESKSTAWKIDGKEYNLAIVSGVVSDSELIRAI